MTSCIPQLSFSFYRHRSIRADFSGGQITSDAGLLPLRAFDQRHGLTRGLAECVCDDRDDSRVSHPGLSLLRQRLYQIIAGYEDANDAENLAAFPPLYVWGPVLLFGGLLFVLHWGLSRTLNRWYLMGYAGMVMASFMSVAVGHTALWDRMVSSFVP